MSNSFNITALNQEQERYHLLQEKAAIEAKLANLPPSNAHTTSNSYHGRRQHPRQDVSRSYSHTGPSMSRTVSSSGRGQHEAPAMSATISQRSAPTMARTGSKGSSSSSSIPWANTGRVPPPLQIESYTTSRDDPVSNYTVHRSSSQRKPDLEQVLEIDSGMHPTEFFARHAMPVLSVTPSPIDIPTPGGQWRTPNQHHRRSMSSRRRQSFGIPTPTTPSTATLTTATTFASDMSRQSSFCNDGIIGSFEMMNVHSNTSFLSDNSADERSYHSGTHFPTSSYPKLSSSEEQSLILAGAGGASHDSQYSLSFQDSRASATQFPPIPSFLEDMKRSQSNDSSVSASSTKSRATTMLKRQVQLATRPLAPKAGAEEVAMSQEGSHTMVSIKSRDGSGDRVVAQIPKATYQRPKHDRVFCDRCADYPEGFRGAHELGRHQDRQHKEHVKKWVCIEPVDGIINSQYQPVNSFSKCKACSQQKKKYGAYYNAAAHLRRAHFKPKARGRAKCPKVEDKPEKRGGKAGGFWPPMSELKRWMVEVEEHVSEGQEEEDDDDDDDDDRSGEFGLDEDYSKLQPLSANSVGSSNFDNTLAFDATMIDTYPTPASNYTSQGMQNMQFDLPLAHSIELVAMQLDSSQSSFIDSHYASMNDMAFIDHFSQNFDDPSLSQDQFNNFPFQM